MHALICKSVWFLNEKYHKITRFLNNLCKNPAKQTSHAENLIKCLILNMTTLNYNTFQIELTEKEVKAHFIANQRIPSKDYDYL